MNVREYMLIVASFQYREWMHACITLTDSAFAPLVSSLSVQQAVHINRNYFPLVCSQPLDCFHNIWQFWSVVDVKNPIMLKANPALDLLSINIFIKAHHLFRSLLHAIQTKISFCSLPVHSINWDSLGLLLNAFLPWDYKVFQDLATCVASILLQAFNFCPSKMAFLFFKCAS